MPPIAIAASLTSAFLLLPNTASSFALISCHSSNDSARRRRRPSTALRHNGAASNTHQRQRADVEFANFNCDDAPDEYERPTIRQTYDAAEFIQSRLDKLLLEREGGGDGGVDEGGDGINAADFPYYYQPLLNDLHFTALTLMEFDDHDHDRHDGAVREGAIPPMERAIELLEYSLNNFDTESDGNGGNLLAIRERLSAAYRDVGKLEQSAIELHKVIRGLGDGEGEDGNGVDVSTLCLLYLDLGSLIEEARPLPGAGCELTSVAPAADDGALLDLPKFEFDDASSSTSSSSTSLSAMDCYQRAIRLDPSCGLAHKKLADVHAVLGRDRDAIAEFELAAGYMPEDVCCATHLHFARRKKLLLGGGEGNINNGMKKKRALRLDANLGVAKTLDELCVHCSDGLFSTADDLSSIAAKFEMNGALVLPSMVDDASVDAVSKCVADIISAAESDEGESSVADFTDETKAKRRRVHMALPLSGSNATTEIIVSDLLRRLHPILSMILHEEDQRQQLPLIGSGFMQTSPGASGQELHKDVHHHDRHSSPFDGMPDSWDCDANGHPRCVSIQLQLTDTTTTSSSRMGSLEVLPGSHRPDIENGKPSRIERAANHPNDSKSGVIPVNVPPGTVTIYSSRLWHRGGSNRSDRERKFCFFTVAERDMDCAPPGLIHTMQISDVGKWSIDAEHGLSQLGDN